MNSSSRHDNPYGVGLAYRFNVHSDAVKNRGEIDLLEISTEDYIVRERRTYSDPDERLLRDALDRFPCVAHGLSLSIGTVEELSRPYLQATKRFMAEHGLNVFSEHLAFHRADGNDLTMFLAIPFEEVAVQWVKQNYEAVSGELGRPFALENVTYSFPAPHSALSEAQFLTRICEETDCTLLLDVTNVFNNAHNQGYDPYEFLESLPMHRVSQMHLAGGHQLPDGRWEDSHSAPVMEPVWPLFDAAVRLATNVRTAILERDSKLHPFDSVMSDIRRAREIFYAHRPMEAPAGEPALPSRVDGTVAPDPLEPEFAGLRGYQRILMGRIADPDFREDFLRDAPAAAARFGVSDPEWFRKVVDCDERTMHQFAEAYDYFQREDEEVKNEYDKREWDVWARELGTH